MTGSGSKKIGILNNPLQHELTGLSNKIIISAAVCLEEWLESDL